MSLYIKMSEYFTIKNITAGFFIAFLSAGAIYLDWLGFMSYFINTILGLSTLYFLLTSNKKTWVSSGFWIGILWFWWIAISFKNYDMAWMIPLAILGVGLIYMGIFFVTITLFEFIEHHLPMKENQRYLFDLTTKVVILLLLSYIHPFGFDWFKPELMLTNSYLGIEKWQFGLVLLALVVSLYKKQLRYLLLILLAYPFATHFEKKAIINPKITLYTTHTSVQDKWNQKLISEHINEVFVAIKKAIENKQRVIVFPESVLAFFVNMHPQIMEELQHYSHKIIIVVGGLYWDNTTPHNSTYIFKNESYQIANKVKLVPFGEENPLPDFMGKWINKIFFDGAPDYVASADFTDYSIDGVQYRNAICFEATSEKLYEGQPKNMIVLSNNGWFTPSIEATQQKILLQYYSKKYGTTIYHSTNMSDSYIVQNGKVIKNK